MGKETSDIGKKCAGTGVALKRARRYFRNGLYFRNRAAFKAFEVKEAEKKTKEV